MTDRYAALTVALERDIREDDAQAIIQAIRQLRGVLAVTPLVAEPGVWTAHRRARRELEQKLHAALFDGSEDAG